MASSCIVLHICVLSALRHLYGCDFCDTVFFLIRFRTHSGWKSTFVLLSEENEKSEPFSYREKVRIFYFNGSPPGRHSYGSRNRTLTKAPPAAGPCCSSPLIRRGECQETQISGSPPGRRSYGSRNRGLINSPLGCCLRHCVPPPCSSPLSHRKRKTRTLQCSGFSWCG